MWGLLTAIVMSAGVVASGRGRDSTGRAVELLRSWLSVGSAPQWQTSLYGDMTFYAMAAGDLEAAWELSQYARATAERTEHVDQIRIARKAQAGVLARMGCGREALAMLPAEVDKVFVSRLEDAAAGADVFARQHTPLSLGEHERAGREPGIPVTTAERIGRDDGSPAHGTTKRTGGVPTFASGRPGSWEISVRSGRWP
jgi:hypothetical protein